MIVLQDVRAGYGGDDVLTGISLQIPDGENLSIIGPNGCGKTTLLRTIAGTLPFQGEIFLDGQSVKTMKRKAMAKKTAMLSQITAVYFNYTVLDTVLMGRYVHAQGFMSGISHKDRQIALEALSTVGMLELKDRAVDTLSGGQLQRVFLAKVLAQDPNIILLDEPTNHLDLSYQVELIRFLCHWSAQEGKSVVGVLHDINLAVTLADNLVLMEKGQIAAQGKAGDVLGSPALSRAYKMDVSAYMVESLRYWEEIRKKSPVAQP